MEQSLTAHQPLQYLVAAVSDVLRNHLNETATFIALNEAHESIAEVCTTLLNPPRVARIVDDPEADDAIALRPSAFRNVCPVALKRDRVAAEPEDAVTVSYAAFKFQISSQYSRSFIASPCHYVLQAYGAEATLPPKLATVLFGTVSQNQKIAESCAEKFGWTLLDCVDLTAKLCGQPLDARTLKKSGRSKLNVPSQAPAEEGGDPVPAQPPVGNWKLAEEIAKLLGVFENEEKLKAFAADESEDKQEPVYDRIQSGFIIANATKAVMDALADRFGTKTEVIIAVDNSPPEDEEEEQAAKRIAALDDETADYFATHLEADAAAAAELEDPITIKAGTLRSGNAVAQVIDPFTARPEEVTDLEGAISDDDDDEEPDPNPPVVRRKNPGTTGPFDPVVLKNEKWACRGSKEFGIDVNGCAQIVCCSEESKNTLMSDLEYYLSTELLRHHGGSAVDLSSPGTLDSLLNEVPPRLLVIGGTQTGVTTVVDDIANRFGFETIHLESAFRREWKKLQEAREAKHKKDNEPVRERILGENGRLRWSRRAREPGR